VEDLIGKKAIKVQVFPFLPATLPYKTVAIGNKIATITDGLRHKISFEVATDPFFGADMSLTVNFSEFVGKRVTLSYIPATVADQQTVDQYGGLYETPPYLIKVKPQLKIEGVVNAEGVAVGMGMDQTLNMIFSLPNIGLDQVQNTITAGGYYAVGLVADRLPSGYSVELQKRAKRLDDFVKAGGNRGSDQGLGEQLYLSAMTYFWEVDRQTDVLASQGDVVYAKQSGEGIFALSLSVLTLFGVPRRTEVTGTNIDVDRLVYIPFSKTGDTQAQINFMTTSGSVGSGSEHGIIEQMYGVDAISAVKAIHLANQQGIRIYQITASNRATVLPLLQVSNAVKADINNAVNAGKEVLIPERELLVNDWRGVGYIVSDPATGAAGYLISGGIAGGANTLKKILSEILGIMERALVRIGCLLEPAHLKDIAAPIIWSYLIIEKFASFPFLFKVFAAIVVFFAVVAILNETLECIAQTANADFRHKYKRRYLSFSFA